MLVPKQYPGGPEVKQVLQAPPATIGLNLAHRQTDGGDTFLVDTGTQEWWMASQQPDGSWTELIPRASYADRVHDPVSWLEVQVRDGTPTFLVNETDVSATTDLSWLRIPQTGDAGIVIASSAATPTEPPLAVFESFGIYALTVDEADGLGTASPLTTLLPTLDEVPAGLVLVQEGTRTADEITATFPDPVEAAQRFQGWGWQENAYRDFASRDGTTSVSVSLHRFADPQSAADALSYLADARAMATGVEPTPVADIGDQVEAVAGQVAGGHEVSLYVRKEAVVARVTVVTSAGEPLAIARETAIAMLRK